MPTATPSSTKSAVRFCGSCAVLLACWTVWIALGVSLGTLIYIAVAKELPVPGFILRRVETELAKAELSISFGRARLDPNGKILLNDVQLHSQRFAEPLITARMVYLQRNFWSVLAGQPIPDEIRVEGAIVQLPAMLSPSGTVEPVLRDVAFEVRHRNRTWHIDQLTARVGRLAFTAQGELAQAPRSASSLTINELTARFLKTSRQLATISTQFDAFENPLLHVRYQAGPAGNLATAIFTATGAQQPFGKPVTLGPMVAAFSGVVDVNRPHPVAVYAAARRVNYDDDYSADNVRGIVNLQFSPLELTLKPLDATVASARATVRGEPVLGPVIRAGLAQWPELHTEFAAQIRGEFLAAEIDARLKEQSARVHAEGRASHEIIRRVLEEITPRAAPYFEFGSPVAFRADLVLDPGWKFARLRSTADGGHLNSRGVGITELRGRVDIDGMSFLAHDAIVRLGDNYARGSYWMDFATTEYRMLLNGRLRPTEINGWFRGDWWLNFWNDNFDFSAALPDADVDVQGVWKDPAFTQYFGRAEASAAKMLTADFTDIHTLIFLRPNFTHGLEISGRRASGQQELSGWFKRFTDPATTETNQLAFAVDSTVDAETYLKLTRSSASVVLDNLKFKRPARVHAEGSIDGKWPGATANLTFNGRAAGGVSFYDFPLETVQVAGDLKAGELHLNDIQIGAAGGKATGKAALTGPVEARRLAFDVQAKGADLGAAIRTTLEFQSHRGDGKPAPVGDSEFIKRAAGGKLDLSLAAQGTPGDFNSFTGNGAATLTGANLGEIQLFGLLSQALSGLSLNFSSLKMDTARTTFHLERGALHFPDLKITGSGAVIDARGDYSFETNTLDFTAKLKPFEENRNILTAAIGFVLNPLTGIFELKLSGPLSKPDWSVKVSPASLKPEAPAVAPESPGVPETRSPETPLPPKN